MRIGSTAIVDATCEAFRGHAVRLVTTAADTFWLDAAVNAFCGYGTSVIGCDAEVGVERPLSRAETPDGRPGAALMAFGFRAESVAKAVANRVGQALLTAPTVAVFDGLPEATRRASLGDHVRYFGDGYERASDEAWTVPTMEGDVTLPRTMGIVPAVGGGVLIVGGVDAASALAGAKRAADAVAAMPGVITPFPGGVCRSGSKAGSRYRGLVASTNEAFCPTLRDRVATRLPPEANAVYEVVYDALDEATLRAAMAAGLRAAAGEGVVCVTTCNYEGKLGGVRIPLRDLL